MNPTLCGVITLAGGGEARYYFEVGSTTAYGQNIPAKPGAEVNIPADQPSIAVDAELSGLPGGTTYHYRLVASANGDVGYGQDLTFTTQPEPGQPPEAPITEPCPGPAALDGGQQLCGTLNPGSNAAIGYYFALNQGPSCAGGSKLDGHAAEGQGLAVSAYVTGLEPNTQYAYCLVATNAFGETFGQTLIFKTPPGSIPITPPQPAPGNAPQSSDVTTPHFDVPPLPLPKSRKPANASKRCKVQSKKMWVSCERRLRAKTARG